MKRVPPFNAEVLEAIAKALGDTATGLTGSEIGHTLAKCLVEDVDPGNTKWKRLYNALAEHQNREQWGNHVVAFVHKAMRPARWSDREQFESVRAQLNRALVFAGLELGSDGLLKRVQAAKTIEEAEERADRLRSKLKSRGVHADVLRFCRAEWLAEDYFHAVLEATKSVAQKIRDMTGLTADGASLAQEAFAGGAPRLAINALVTETERGEQRGFANLLVGLFGMFRNPTAHAPRIHWPMSEEDALDILSLVSLVHRKLDAARLVRPAE